MAPDSEVSNKLELLKTSGTSAESQPPGKAQGLEHPMDLLAHDKAAGSRHYTPTPFAEHESK